MAREWREEPVGRISSDGRQFEVDFGWNVDELWTFYRLKKIDGGFAVTGSGPTTGQRQQRHATTKGPQLKVTRTFTRSYLVFPTPPRAHLPSPIGPMLRHMC